MNITTLDFMRMSGCSKTLAYQILAGQPKKILVIRGARDAGMRPKKKQAVYFVPDDALKALVEEAARRATGERKW